MGVDGRRDSVSAVIFEILFFSYTYNYIKMYFFYIHIINERKTCVKALNLFTCSNGFGKMGVIHIDQTLPIKAHSDGDPAHLMQVSSLTLGPLPLVWPDDL